MLNIAGGDLIVAPSVELWLAAVAADPEEASRRTDWWRNTNAVMRAVARRIDGHMITSPKRGGTWSVMADDAGVRRRTFAGRLAWAKERGYLLQITEGSTPRYRSGTFRGLLDDGLGNLAAEYLLTIPIDALRTLGLDDEQVEELIREPEPQPMIREPFPAMSQEEWKEAPWPVETLAAREICTPRVSAFSPRESKPLRARDARDTRPRWPSASPPTTKPERLWPNTVTPGKKSDRLEACERLRYEDQTLRGVSAKYLRSLLRPLFAAGATLADAKYVINHRPDGRPWPNTDPPRNLVGWVRHRVSTWFDKETGRLAAPLPSQVIARADRRRRAEQAARAEERARLEARRVDPPAELIGPLRARLQAIAAASRERRKASADQQVPARASRPGTDRLGRRWGSPGAGAGAAIGASGA
ncbi:hypothetical protein Ppa06_65710 [Planomonospora parontospora subsp. parontospora]|uniref:Uncharacterized protein n=2 Tax=Planomonospora parontospora TaxID=58119 RepID=A0AA37BN00_9ACTN|nr:hypothetical protein [Planomonospora parontospora]GGK96562.1 hypothetical protein GCM10010126_64970 [Planomonospora parontospora]GII12773.1 hypothetical protein Ppa06_65710 [Planomonospora parontospora subsp. parontospora]